MQWGGVLGGTTVKRFRIFVAAAVLVISAGVVAPPPAQAMMPLGNYNLNTNRYDRASWVWFVHNCWPDKQPDCVNVSARPRLKFYAYYEGEAKLVDGNYTLTVDVPDGLVCLPGFGEGWAVSMPTHETWTWNERSLAGTIESRYDVGCFNGPPGTQFWTFALQRL